eukprot:gene9083-10025_t
MSIELKGESPLERSAEEEEKVKVASFVEILSNADRWDCILMLVGTAGGIITGAIIPTMNVLFGKIMDDLNGDSSDIRKKIASLCVTLVVVAAVNFFSAMAQVLCWTLAGERQTQRYRERYVRAILSQEVGWFDQCGAHELSTKVANLTGKAQDGMTRKVGDFIQYAAQILSCVIVAFYYNWKITLVLLATVPFMGFAGNYMISAITEAQIDGLEEGTDVSLKDKGEVQSIAALSDVKVDEESGLVLANDPANEADDEEIDSIEQKEDNLSVSQRVRSIILRSPILLLVALVGSLLFGGTFPAWGYLLAKAQNSYYAETAHDIRTESSFYACLFILVAGVSFFSAIAQYYGILTIGERLTFQLRSEMFEALMRQPMAFFDNPHHSVGALSSELAEAPRLVHRAFGESLAKQLMALSSAIVGIILAFISSWRMALVVLATFPLMIGASAVQMQAFQGQQHEEIEEKKPEHVEDVKPPPLLDSAKEGEEKKERESARQIEAPTSGLFASSPATLLAMAFTQIRTISAFSFQAAISEQYALLTSLRSLKRQRRAVVASMAFGSSNSIMLLSFSLMFWFGSEEILAGRLDFDELLVAVLDKLRGRIELKNVRFAYPSRPDTNVCRDYNLTIEPGQTVALVGPSGSGKVRQMVDCESLALHL